MPKPLTSELLFDEEGNPEERFLPVDFVIVPSEIELASDEETLYVLDDEAYWHGVGERRRVTAATLAQFVRLADHNAHRIAQFSKRWGLLGLCEHEKPATHHLEDRDGYERPRLLPYMGCTPADSEAVERWRSYSRLFRKVIEAAERLHRGESVADSDWETIRGPYKVFQASKVDSLELQRKRLARILNFQLAASGIQPIMQWRDNEPSLGFAVFGALRTSLYAALVMQLIQVASDAKIAFCAWCQTTYRPARRTHPGQPNYCSGCRKDGIPGRVRVQRHRDRRRVTSAEPRVHEERDVNERELHADEMRPVR